MDLVLVTGLFSIPTFSEDVVSIELAVFVATLEDLTKAFGRPFSFTSIAAPTKYGCAIALLEVMRFVASYATDAVKRSKQLSFASGNSLERPIPCCGGKEYFAWVDACFFSLERTAAGGVPSTRCIRFIWSTSSVPGNNGYSVVNSNKMHPAPQMSISGPYIPHVRRHSGGRYHLVDMYSVNGGFPFIPLHDPKSASFRCFPDVSTRIFSGY